MFQTCEDHSMHTPTACACCSLSVVQFVSVYFFKTPLKNNLRLKAFKLLPSRTLVLHYLCIHLLFMIAISDIREIWLQPLRSSSESLSGNYIRCEQSCNGIYVGMHLMTVFGSNDVNAAADIFAFLEKRVV